MYFLNSFWLLTSEVESSTQFMVLYMISKQEIHIYMFEQNSRYIKKLNKYFARLPLDIRTMRFRLSYHLLVRILQNLIRNLNFDQDQGPLCAMDILYKQFPSQRFLVALF